MHAVEALKRGQSKVGFRKFNGKDFDDALLLANEDFLSSHYAASNDMYRARTAAFWSGVRSRARPTVEAEIDPLICICTDVIVDVFVAVTNEQRRQKALQSEIDGAFKKAFGSGSNYGPGRIKKVANDHVVDRLNALFMGRYMQEADRAPGKDTTRLYRKQVSRVINRAWAKVDWPQALTL